MARPREKEGRSVFIGNIPYGVSEEQICEIFGRIGTVINFRLVYDKETGKPKGYGFLEFTDADHSAAAIRNLNGHEIMGRTLKVDYSNDNSAKGGHQPHAAHDSNRAPPPAHFDMSGGGGGMGMQPPVNGAGPGDLPPMPQGVDLPPGMTATDAISQTLQAIPTPQLLDIVSQMKNLVQGNPQQATQLLATAPQLSYAIFQALLLLGLVDTNVIAQLVQQMPQQQQPQAPPPQPVPQQSYYPPQQQPPQPQFNPQQPPIPYGAPPPQQTYQQPPQAYNPTPPVQQQAYQPPPYQQPQLPSDPTQAALIRQVLAMSREQIRGLDEGPRQQIMQLRQQYGAPVS